MVLWTPEEVKFLIEEHNKGTSMVKIAELLNRSHTGTMFKARNLGLKSVIRWTDDEVITLIEEYNKGTPVAKIANIIGRRRNSVSFKAYKLGLKHPYFNGNCEYGGSGKTLLHRLQNGEPKCIRCGISKFLTINHKFGDGSRLRSKYGSHTKEYRYWLKRPIEECRENLEVLCMNCNKLEYYDRDGISKDPLQEQVLERIAEAHDRPIECFECGYSKDIRVLEIDHKIKDAYKSDSLYSRILSMPLSEIKKRYQILCSNHNFWKDRY